MMPRRVNTLINHSHSNKPENTAMARINIGTDSLYNQLLDSGAATLRNSVAVSFSLSSESRRGRVIREEDK
jgi:hypothetical protein